MHFSVNHVRKIQNYELHISHAELKNERSYTSTPHIPS
jgi:hypothetical protein